MMRTKKQWIGNWGAALIVMSALLPACAVVPPEVVEQIQVNAAVGDGTLSDWDDLAPEEIHEAYWYAVQAFHDLDWSLSDVPVPEAFLGVYPGGE